MMATRTPSLEERGLLKSIDEDVPWENLSKRIKLFLGSHEEWQRRVKVHCMQKQLKWNESAARRVIREAEYYDELVRFSRKNLGLFPYHLADYVCRIMRISPFKYYCDLLFDVMRQELSYDSIPNFCAADALRETGIGRNKYIDILNKAKAKLMWKINKSFAKEMFPSQPVDFLIEQWWRICVVNLSLEEYRKLTQSELFVIEKCSKDDDSSVEEFDYKIVNSLYKRGLIYFDVTVYPYDRFQVSSLEGFVSNRNLQQQDQVEELLYSMFVASSEQTTVEELCITLQSNIMQLSYAISLACRLGWAKKVMDDPSSFIPPERPSSPFPIHSSSSSPFSSRADPPPMKILSLNSLNLSHLKTVSSPSLSKTSYHNDLSSHSPSPSPIPSRCRFAFIVDASLTSFLMMGSFSHGLKQQAVTLFEAGKLNNQSVKQLCIELKSVEGMKMEGELQRLAEHAKSLFIALNCIKHQSLDDIISPSSSQPSYIDSQQTDAKSSQIKSTNMDLLSSPLPLISASADASVSFVSSSSSSVLKPTSLFASISRALGSSVAVVEKKGEKKDEKKKAAVGLLNSNVSLMDAWPNPSSLPYGDELSLEKKMQHQHQHQHHHQQTEWNQSSSLYEVDDEFQEFQSAENQFDANSNSNSNSNLNLNLNSDLVNPSLLANEKVNWDQILDEIENKNDGNNNNIMHKENSYDNLLPTFDHPITPSSRSNSEKDRFHLEVLRSESLTNLPYSTLHRLLKRDYSVIVSMSPISSPLITSHKEEDDPAHYGLPSAAAVTPWMKLLLYVSAGAGPMSVALMKGLRFRHLPPPLFGCKRALVWSWEQASGGGMGSKAEGSVVDGHVLLHVINGLLRFSALLVQPLGIASVHTEPKSSELFTQDIPLPLASPSNPLQLPPLPSSLASMDFFTERMHAMEGGREEEASLDLMSGDKKVLACKSEEGNGDDGSMDNVYDDKNGHDGRNGDGGDAGKSIHIDPVDDNNRNNSSSNNDNNSNGNGNGDENNEFQLESHPSVINLIKNLNLNTLGYLRMLRVKVREKVEEKEDGGKEEGEGEKREEKEEENEDVDENGDTDNNNAFDNDDGMDDGINEKKGKCIHRFDWLPLTLEFGMPLFDSKLCRKVCEGALKERLFDPSSLKKQKQAMVSLKNRLKEFMDKYKSGGLLTRRMYEKHPSMNRRSSIGLDQTSSFSSSSPLTSAIALQSPKKFSLEDSHELVRNLSEIAYISSPEPQFLKVGFVEAIHVPVREGSEAENNLNSPRVTGLESEKDALNSEKEASSHVPLPGSNLLFDGKQLVPFDISSYLQGRVAASIIALAK